MIITVIALQISSVLPNRITPNHRKESKEKSKLPNNLKPSYRKILFQIAEHKIF